MQLSREAKGAIAFLLVIAVGHNWSAISNVFKPPWQPWPPLIPLMKDFVVPFMHHVYRPILIGFTGLAVYWMWQERREGYLVAMVLTLIASGFGVLVTIFNLFGNQWSGAFTCLVAFAFPAVMAFWFSYRGYMRSNQSE